MKLKQRILFFLARHMPRELAHAAGVRILSEVTRPGRRPLSKAERQILQGEIRMLHALDLFINAKP